MGKKKPANPRFEVYRGIGTDWHWRLIARNGEIVASGEGFTLQKDAERAVKAVVRAVLTIDANGEGEIQFPRREKAK